MRRALVLCFNAALDDRVNAWEVLRPHAVAFAFGLVAAFTSVLLGMIAALVASKRLATRYTLALRSQSYEERQALLASKLRERRVSTEPNELTHLLNSVQTDLDAEFAEIQKQLSTANAEHSVVVPTLLTIANGLVILSGILLGCAVLVGVLTDLPSELRAN